MGANLDAVRAAVILAKGIAKEFHTGTASFYNDGNTTPFLVCDCRVKKPKPSSFDAGDQTRWGTKRAGVIKIDQDQPDLAGHDELIRAGTIVQISTPDGDPSINHINFTVQSALNSQFSAEREISVTTEVQATPRIV